MGLPCQPDSQCAPAKVVAVSLAGLKWRIRRLRSDGLAAGRKLAWIAHRSATGPAIPVFIVGSQRSGTGMLGQCLGQSPEFVNLGESDPRAFLGYTLRDDDVIGRMIDRCRFRHLVFKPLKDSHRISGLLSLREHGRAVWAYRNPMDRINSAIRQFGSHPVQAFKDFTSGKTTPWQLQGASEKVQRTIQRFDFCDMSDADGAALMWWVRNSLYVDLGLQGDQRMRLWSYDAFVSDPEAGLRRLLRFLDGQFHPYMLDSVHARSLRKEGAPSLNPEIFELCRSLYEQLEAESAKQSREKT